MPALAVYQYARITQSCGHRFHNLEAIQVLCFQLITVMSGPSWLRGWSVLYGKQKAPLIYSMCLAKALGVVKMSREKRVDRSRRVRCLN